MATDAIQWSPEAQEAVDWFMTTEPPAEGFALQSGVYVSNPANYWAYLRMNVGEGPGGSRAAALIFDLGKLRGIFES